MTDSKIFDRYLEGERPGEYPFTRGIHKEMYRKRLRLWTRRQQSGYGTPEGTLPRYEAKAQRVSVRE